MMKKTRYAIIILQLIAFGVAMLSAWMIGRWWGLLFVWMIGVYVNLESKYHQFIWKESVNTVMETIKNFRPKP